jgi:2-C-methyl-D-erythritol 4-phosphate cytidylyltransferase
MRSPPDVGVVVVAAGRGERAGGDLPKQFQNVGGTPVLLRAIRPFLSHPQIGPVIVVVAPEVAESPPSWLGAIAGERLSVVAGGAERMDSVERGLAALDPAVAIVVVHDGARPFVDPDVIDRVIGEARLGHGAIAAVPVADTLKECDAAGPADPITIRRTVPREGLWRAQTPQGFPAAVLRQALAQARSTGRRVTDDASAVEAIGVPVRLIHDRSTNLKITSPEDFQLADAIARMLPR